MPQDPFEALGFKPAALDVVPVPRKTPTVPAAPDPFAALGFKPTGPLPPTYAGLATQAEGTAPSLKTFLDVPLDIGVGIEQASGIDPMHPITSLPSAAKGVATGIYNLATSPVQTLRNMVSGLGEAVTSGGQAIRSGNVPEAAQAVGRGFVIGEAAKGLGQAGASLARAGVSAIPKSGPLAAAIEKSAAVDIAKAIQPTSLESKATVQVIAPELAKRGLSGVTGKGIDKGIMAKLADSELALNNVTDRLKAEPRPEFQISRDSMVDQLDGALNRLEKYPQVNRVAIQAMKRVRSEFLRLPRYADFEQVLDLRRTLDNAIDDAGGFKNASSAADRTIMKVQRGAANVAAQALNNIDPEFKLANQDYSLYRNAADVVERRHLGQVGAADVLPGRNTLLDDILAGWVGNAIGGSPGAAIAEGVNLLRQTRGVANIKAGAKQSLADLLRPAEPSPAGLLTSGQIRLTQPETSRVGASAAGIEQGTRATRTGRLLPLPKNIRITPPPPDPSRLVVIDAQRGIAVDPNTGVIHTYFLSQ